MIFAEWAQSRGLSSARLWFNFGDHAVFVVTHGRHVQVQCGQWIASSPLNNGESITSAIDRLSQSCCDAYKTAKIVIITP